MGRFLRHYLSKKAEGDGSNKSYVENLVIAVESDMVHLKSLVSPKTPTDQAQVEELFNKIEQNLKEVQSKLQEASQ